MSDITSFRIPVCKQSEEIVFRTWLELDVGLLQPRNQGHGHTLEHVAPTKQTIVDNTMRTNEKRTKLMASEAL